MIDWEGEETDPDPGVMPRNVDLLTIRPVNAIAPTPRWRA